MAERLGGEAQQADRAEAERPDRGIGFGRGAGPFFVPGWRTRRGMIGLDQPVLMGVLNVTPDSFWEGSRRNGVDRALAAAEAMLDAGADVLDIGGESTRPGAKPVPAKLERERVEPVIQAVLRHRPDAIISVDTVKAEVAEAALAAGAAIVNDVSALRLDEHMGHVVAEHEAGLVLMHSRGSVERMASYDEATYGADPVAEVVDELTAALDRATAAGVNEDRIVLDPGLGFSKRTEHSVAVLRELDRILALGRPVLVGPSRKRFVGELAGGLPVEDRLPGSIAACVVAYGLGARIFRVHDVGPVRDALAVAHALGSGP